MKNSVAICMVKNESDVIESFIRHNSKFIDRFVIIDNGSIDGTNEILKALISEGFDIEIFDESKSAFDHEYFMNKYIHSTLADSNFEFVFPLDSDEFIETDMSRDVFFATLPRDKFSLLKWKTYVPTSNDDASMVFVPKRITHSRKAHFEEFEKVVIPTELFIKKQGRLAAGNHSVHNIPDHFFWHHNHARIAHFPIRSEQQVVSKVAIGYINVLGSTNWSDGDGFHWKAILDRIKGKEVIELQNIALNYAVGSCQPTSSDDSIERAGFFENAEIQLRFYSFANCDPFLNLLNNAETMARRLADTSHELAYYEKSVLCRFIKQFGMSRDRRLRK